MGMDIGPKTIEAFTQAIQGAGHRGVERAHGGL